MIRFLVDAHLPRGRVRVVRDAGCEAVHTSELPRGNATTDGAINRVSLEQRRVVVTKDADFVQSFTLRGRPYGLLLISTGKIPNSELLQLVSTHVKALFDLFEEHRFVEITREALIAHG